MKPAKNCIRVLGAMGIAALLSSFVYGSAHGQWVTKWLDIGEMHVEVSASGGHYETDRAEIIYPAEFPQISRMRAITRGVTATNWTSPEGDHYAVKIASAGQGVTGVGQVFPTKMDLISRFEPTTVTVDGAETFQRSVTVDRVDPALPSDRMMHNVINTVTGITIDRKVMVWGQEYHDNYYITDVTLTNTGNTDRDEDIELPDATMEGVYYFEYYRHEGPGDRGWGNYDMNDVVTGESTDEIDDYEIDFRGMFTWYGYRPQDRREMGDPLITQFGLAPREDTVGRLQETAFQGGVALHVDESAASTAHDPAQPSTLGWYWLVEEPGWDHENATETQLEYEDVITAGIMWPHHADVIAPPTGEYANVSWTERMANQADDPGRARNGISSMWAYGPYTLAPGESVRIVYAYASDGISTQAAVDIGKAYKAANVWNGGSPGNKDPKIPYDANADGNINDRELLTKNEWFLTGRDSLFDAYKVARANFQSEYRIPQAPVPPATFDVTSGVNAIELEWTTHGSNPPQGFELYRAANSWQSDIDNKYEYELIATLPPEARSYSDTEVSRGVDYFYYIQSVGDVNNDPTGMTPTDVRLKSNRYHTQTYDPVRLLRAPGASMDAVRIVPNPYNLASDRAVRWPDRQDKLGFIDVPGNATIRIYSEVGELIDTIEHTGGSGDAYWDLTTSSHQVIASGVYIAHITDEDTGEQVAKTFIIIR